MPCRATPLPPHFHFLLLPLPLPTLCSSPPFLLFLSIIWTTFPFPYVSPMPPAHRAPSLYSPCTSLVPTTPTPLPLLPHLSHAAVSTLRTSGRGTWRGAAVCGNDMASPT